MGRRKTNTASHPVSQYIGSVMKHDLVKLCAVFFAAAIFLKGCDLLEGKPDSDSEVKNPDKTLKLEL